MRICSPQVNLIGKKETGKSKLRNSTQIFAFSVNLELSARINMHLSYQPLTADMHPNLKGSDYLLTIISNNIQFQLSFELCDTQGSLVCRSDERPETVIEPGRTLPRTLARSG